MARSVDGRYHSQEEGEIDLPFPKGGHHSINAREAIGRASKERWANKEYKDRISRIHRERPHKMTESNKQKLSEFNSRPKPWMRGENNPSKRPDVRAKISEAKKGIATVKGETHGRWKGGISFEPYCPRFTREFKERVRAFFGYICPNCGTPQNGEKLGVHHIHHNKDTCCDGSIPLFIPLCRSCHGYAESKKNGTQYEQHFTELINTWYGGKCYLTREEMKAYATPTLQG